MYSHSYRALSCPLAQHRVFLPPYNHPSSFPASPFSLPLSLTFQEHIFQIECPIPFQVPVPLHMLFAFLGMFFLLLLRFSSDEIQIMFQIHHPPHPPRRLQFLRRFPPGAFSILTSLKVSFIFLSVLFLYPVHFYFYVSFSILQLLTSVSFLSESEFP